MLTGSVNLPLEFALAAAGSYSDIFNEIDVDVLVRGPGGREWAIPAFWAGENLFRFRFAAPLPGHYSFESRCSNEGDAGLHGQIGEFQALPYTGMNRLAKHGRPVVSENHRTLEHSDGTPFFWLGDTWWMALSPRLDWPTGFHRLCADRAEKGFNLIQIVVGPNPEYLEDKIWDPEQSNEAGWPWEEGWTRINPAYFDYADRKLQALVDYEMVPCIVGTWGYYVNYMGVENAKKHWRYLIARYGAYPVVWCLCGEIKMPPYDRWDEESMTMLRASQSEAWTEIGRYVHATDPFDSIVTVHPSYADSSRNQVDPSVLDLEMLQTGHDGYPGLARTVEMELASNRVEPRMPVINAEPAYEGIFGGSWQEVQRFCFWTSMTSGSAGHTYGAQGLWGMNTPENGFFGSFVLAGEGYWFDVMHYPGSAQMGVGRRFFERFPWWDFEPIPEPGLPEGHIDAYKVGLPGKLAIYYLPGANIPWELQGMVTNNWGPLPAFTLDPSATYRAYFLNPRNGEDTEIGEITTDESGKCSPGKKPSVEDWVLVFEKVD